MSDTNSAPISNQQPVARLFFVAGTDTEVGKTLVSTGLMKKALIEGLSTVAMKPVAAGAEPSHDGLRNDDAVALMKTSSVKLPYQTVNPICLQLPVSPHIAAQRAKTTISLAQLVGSVRDFDEQTTQVSFRLCEGAGGWLTPINEDETLADVVKALKMPVVLVVGVKLGCLNHAMLTADRIVQDGLELVGWVANFIDPDMRMGEQNVQTLKNKISAPLLGAIPFCSTPEKLEQYVTQLELPNVASNSQ